MVNWLTGRTLDKQKLFPARHAVFIDIQQESDAFLNDKAYCSTP
jgi:hypothetical protein